MGPSLLLAPSFRPLVTCGGTAKPSFPLLRYSSAVGNFLVMGGFQALNKPSLCVHISTHTDKHTAPQNQHHLDSTVPAVFLPGIFLGRALCCCRLCQSALRRTWAWLSCWWCSSTSPHDICATTASCCLNSPPALKW